MSFEGKSCPINGKKVNNTVIRIVAGQVMLLVMCNLYLKSHLIPFLLSIDFGLRAFGKGPFSTLKWNANIISKYFQLPDIKVDEAPKTFAASLGALMAFALFLATIFDLKLLSSFIELCFVIFAALESLFSVCVGCILYQKLSGFTKRFWNKKVPTS
jgi:hypothetical protein